MTDSRAFVERFRATAAALSGTGRERSPTELVDAWGSFVDLSEDGYGDNIYEYENDLAVRGLIEKLLRSDELRGEPGMSWFAEHVQSIDERFQRLLRPERLPVADDVPWWRAHPPRYAGEELAADFRQQYSVEVAVNDG